MHLTGRFALVIVAMWGGWLASTPYMGIDHDARLYSMQAVRWLSPDAYARDPWFSFGSQDRWSIYSPLFALVLTQLGIEAGARWVTLAQGALYVVALLVLAHTLCRGRTAWLAALCAAGVPLGYSTIDMLYVSEGFATARGLAVPLSVIGLAAAYRNRTGLSLGLHGVAFVIHPIMALGPLCVSLLWLAGQAYWLRGALGLALVGIGVLLLGWADVIPVMSDSWRAHVEASGLVFIAQWVIQEPALLAAVFGALALAARFAPGNQRRLIGMVALVSLGGLFLSLLADLWIPVVWLLQAQTWRAFWLAVLVSVMALTVLLAHQVVRRHAPYRFLGLLALVLILALRDFWGWGVLLVAVLAWGASDARLDRLERWARHCRRQVLAFFGLAMLVQMPTVIQGLALHAQRFVGEPGLEFLEGFLRCGGYGLLGFALYLGVTRTSPWVAVLVIGMFLSVAVWLWDLRSDSQRDTEALYNASGAMSPFADAVPRGAVVYWPEWPERVWMQIGTAGYAGTRFTTGMVFSEARTDLMRARLLRVGTRDLSEEDYSRSDRDGSLRERIVNRSPNSGHFRVTDLFAYEQRRTMVLSGLRRLCADPELDFVVDSAEFPGYFRAVHQESLGGRTLVWYLYDCRQMRFAETKRSSADQNRMRLTLPNATGLPRMTDELKRIQLALERSDE